MPRKKNVKIQINRLAYYLTFTITTLGFTACGGATPIDDSPDGGDGDAGPTQVLTDPFAGLPTDIDQWQALCAKGYGDTISEAFCAGNQPPQIRSFAELRNFLGLSGDGIGQQSQLRVTGVFHSTAVSGRTVTPLNPRVFFMPRTLGNINPSSPRPGPTYNIIAFSRGETFAELASKDRVTGQPRFFSFKFSPACESQVSGCNNADLVAAVTHWPQWLKGREASTSLFSRRSHRQAHPADRRVLADRR